MNGYVEFLFSFSNFIKEFVEFQFSQVLLQEDVDMSSGFSGYEINENCFMGWDLQGSDCDDSGKELGMLVELLDVCQSLDIFSLMMVKFEYNLFISGCSSDQFLKVDIYKELIKILKELKVYFFVDKKVKGKVSMLVILKYVFRSVKQVKVNEEYYQLLMFSEGYFCGVDVFFYIVEEMESVIFEYIVKNVDMFVVVVFLVFGKILYIFDQVVFIFYCKRDVFSDVKFVEFLVFYDVGVFYSFIFLYKFFLWSMCSGVDFFI